MAIWAGGAASAISPGRVGLAHSGSTGRLVWLERGREREIRGMMAGGREIGWVGRVTRSEVYDVLPLG